MSDPDFGVVSMLEVEVDPASIRAAKKEIEEISAPPVELQVDRGSDLGGAGGQIANSATSNLDRQFNTQLELDRERNDYLEEIADATGQGGGGLNAGRLRRGGDGGGLGGGGLGGALALLAGGTALAGGAALTLADGVEVPYGGPEPIPVEDPGEVGYGGPEELAVEDPGEVGYGGPEELAVEDPGKVETTVTVETTTGDTAGTGDSTGTGDTSGTGSTSTPGDTAGAGDPNQGGEGLELPPIGGLAAGGAAGLFSAGSDLLSGSGSGSGSDGPLAELALGGLAAGGATALASTGSEVLSGLSASKPGGVLGGSGIGFPSPGGIVAGIAGDARNKKPGNRGPIGGTLTDIFDTGSRGAGGRMAAAGAPLMMSTTPALTGSAGGGQETANRTGQRQSQAPKINYNPTYNVRTDELERQMQGEVEELHRRLDELERAITGGR